MQIDSFNRKFHSGIKVGKLQGKYVNNKKNMQRLTIKITIYFLFILTINSVFAQESKKKKNCGLVKFKYVFPDTLANNRIDTLLKEKIRVYFKKRVKYPQKLFADCVSGNFLVKFKLIEDRVDTTQLKTSNGIHELIDNQIIDLFRKMPCFPLKKIKNTQKTKTSIGELEFLMRFICITIDPATKRKALKARISKIDN